MNKFNLIISPFGLFRDKTLKQTLDLTCELGTVEQNSLTPNSRICEALEPYGQVFPKNNNTIRSLYAENLKCIWNKHNAIKQKRNDHNNYKK